MLHFASPFGLINRAELWKTFKQSGVIGGIAGALALLCTSLAAASPVIIAGSPIFAASVASLLTLVATLLRTVNAGPGEPPKGGV